MTHGSAIDRVARSPRYGTSTTSRGTIGRHCPPRARGTKSFATRAKPKPAARAQAAEHVDRLDGGAAEPLAVERPLAEGGEQHPLQRGDELACRQGPDADGHEVEPGLGDPEQRPDDDPVGLHRERGDDGGEGEPAAEGGEIGRPREREPRPVGPQGVAQERAGRRPDQQPDHERPVAAVEDGHRQRRRHRRDLRPEGQEGEPGVHEVPLEGDEARVRETAHEGSESHEGEHRACPWVGDERRDGEHHERHGEAPQRGQRPGRVVERPVVVAGPDQGPVDVEGAQPLDDRHRGGGDRHETEVLGGQDPSQHHRGREVEQALEAAVGVEPAGAGGEAAGGVGHGAPRRDSTARSASRRST